MYIFALLLLGVLVVYVLTMDLETSVAMKWMTEDNSTNPSTHQIHLHPDGQFGLAVGDSTPTWITTDAMTVYRDSLDIFESQTMGSTARLSLSSSDQIPLWDNYIDHVKVWEIECDTLYIIYGPVPDSQAIYTVNLCIEENSYGQALLLPNAKSDLAFFNFTHSIDEMEKLTGIDFFGDLLDAESEAYLESTHNRLRWLYPEELLNKRIQKNLK